MIRPLAALALRLSDIRFLRYFGASLGALAVDVSAFFAALALGIAAGPASALGYALGILAHWLISSRAVFHDGVASAGRQRTVQKAFFVLSALAGLALTTLIVTLADGAGIDPRAAKLLAIIASFALTYALRARIVFKPGAAI
ncbi:MAG: GtrA family protein [Erythrobacter sp.]